MQKKDETKVTKTAEVKEAAKTATKAATKKAEATAKAATATVKKVEKKAAEAKKTVKKAVKKEENTTKMILQFSGNDVDLATIEDKVKAEFIAEGHRAGNIKKMEIYVKPEDYAAYYVINDGKFSGKINLF